MADKRITIEDPYNVGPGRYATVTQVHTGRLEFTVDFIHVLPGDPPRAILRSRQQVTPAHFKELAGLMQTLLAAYEQQHGPIGTPPAPPVTFN